MQRDDRLLPITIAALLPLGVFSVVFGLVLFFFPDRTDTLFAWTITPPMSAVFVGASYAFGGLIIFDLLWKRRWHPLRVGLPGTWVFSTAMLLATVLHWDRFHQGTPQFYVWFVIYLVLPFALPVIYWRNQARDPGRKPSDLRLSQPIRVAMAIAGSAYALIGLAMFLFPAAFAAIWPWQLTPLMSRVLGGWFMLPGVSAIAGALDARYSAMRLFTRDLMAWQILLLLGSLLHLNDFDLARPLTWAWFTVTAVAFFLTFGLYIYYERLYRARTVRLEQHAATS